MSFRPQSSQHSRWCPIRRLGCWEGVEVAGRPVAAPQESTPAFTMWTTEVLKILAGEAEHLHTPPCTSMHFHAPPCTSVQAAGRKHITIPHWERHKDSCTTRKCTTSTHYSKVSKLLCSGWAGHVPLVSLDVMENLKDDFRTTEKSVKDGCSWWKTVTEAWKAPPPSATAIQLWNSGNEGGTIACSKTGIHMPFPAKRTFSLVLSFSAPNNWVLTVSFQWLFLSAAFRDG